MATRCDPHVLVVGDPGLGKSQVGPCVGTPYGGGSNYSARATVVMRTHDGPENSLYPPVSIHHIWF